MASSFVKDIQNFILSPVAAFRSSRQSSIARAFLYYAVLLVLHAAAAECVTRAVGRALLTATSVTMWPGTPRERLVSSYLDAFPSARVRSRGP